MAVRRSNLAPRLREQAPSMEKALPPRDVEDPLKHLTIQIPDSLRRDLKVWAANQGMSVRQVVETAIRDKISQ